MTQDTLFTAVFASDLGIGQAEAMGVEVYPNPTHGRVYVGAEGEGVEATVEVYDMGGRCLLRESGVEAVDLTPLTMGVYYAKVLHERGVVVKKIVEE